MESLPTQEITKQEAINRIGFVKQQVTTMGFNDSEIPNLMRLEEEVKRGDKDPLTAIEEAEQILRSKQDYH